MYLKHDPFLAPNKTVVTDKSKIRIEIDKVKTKVNIQRFVILLGEIVGFTNWLSDGAISPVLAHMPGGS